MLPTIKDEFVKELTISEDRALLFRQGEALYYLTKIMGTLYLVTGEIDLRDRDNDGLVFMPCNDDDVRERYENLIRGNT